MLKNNGKRAKSAEKPKDSVEAGLLFLQSNKLIVHPRCVNLIDNLEQFCYIKDQKTGEYTDKTTHEHSHGIDGVRYAYADIYTKRDSKTIQKSILGL
jgi:phage terminase large subunit